MGDSDKSLACFCQKQKHMLSVLEVAWHKICYLFPVIAFIFPPFTKIVCWGAFPAEVTCCYFGLP